MLDVNFCNYNTGGMARTLLRGLMLYMEKEKSSRFLFFFLSQMKWLTTTMNDCFLCECLGSRVDLIELN